jgi:hypothetical protein
LPKILLETLPPLFVEFADRVVFGFFKGIAEFVNLLINGIKSLFTRDGRQAITKSIREGFKASMEEFWRLDQLCWRYSIQKRRRPLIFQVLEVV